MRNSRWNPHFSAALLLATAFASGRAAAADTYSFAVKVTGVGRPVILIPGLACSGHVWDTTVEHLKDRYQCHVLTLPGFAGQPPIKPPMLATVEPQILQYIRSNKLVKPILIGHSLGATLALWLASDAPELFSGVVAVDGVPYLASLSNPNITPQMAAKVGDQIQNVYAKMSQADFAAGDKRSLALMIADPVQVAETALDSDKSDPATVGNAVAEMMTTDLRPKMASIKAPVLMFMSGAMYPNAEVLKSSASRYELQIKSIAHHQLITVAKSRHFIFFDAPDVFFSDLDAFLAKLP